MFLQLPLANQLLILCGFIPFELVQGHPAREDDDVHRKFFRSQVRVKEVHRKDESHR